MANDSGLDQARIKYGFWVVICGFVVVVLVLGLAMRNWTDAKDVIAVTGAVGGIVGSLAGAFFGVQVGSVGREKAEAERQQAQSQLQDAQTMARNLAALLSPAEAQRVLNIPETKK